MNEIELPPVYMFENDKSLNRHRFLLSFSSARALKVTGRVNRITPRHKLRYFPFYCAFSTTQKHNITKQNINNNRNFT